MKMYQAVVNTPIVPLALFASERYLLRIEFLSDNVTSLPKLCHPPILREAIEWLVHYFVFQFEQDKVSLKAEGTPFQKKVWRKIQKIPMGETRSYGEIAKSLQTSPRAVGMACRMNPLPIIVPCHRVVAQNGLGGFSGKKSGILLEVKRWLLAHEKELM